MGGPFPMLKYKYIFQIKYTEAVLSNSTRKLLWFKTSKMPTAVLTNKFILLLRFRISVTYKLTSASPVNFALTQRL